MVLDSQFSSANLSPRVSYFSELLQPFVLYFVYVVENDIIGCLLLHQEIVPQPNLNIDLVVDFWISWSTA